MSEMFLKISLSKILVDLQTDKKTCISKSFNRIVKGSPPHIFSFEIYDFFKNTYFELTLVQFLLEFLNRNSFFNCPRKVILEETASKLY